MRETGRPLVTALLRQLATFSCPLSALPRCVVAGNLCAFTMPISCLALARASRCPLVLGRSTTASTCELSPLASGPQGDTISVTFLLCVILGRQPRDTHCFLELLTYSHVKSRASRARLHVTTHSISIDHRPFNANLRYSASPYGTCLTLALRIPARLSRPTHKPWALPNSR